MSTYFRHLYLFLISLFILPTSRLDLLPVTVTGENSCKSRRQHHPCPIQGLCVAMLMGGLFTG